MASNFDKIDDSFEMVTKPEVNYYYHLSWAYRGAKFCLTAILDDKEGIVWTGRKKNKYLKINLSDLRHLKHT